MMKSLKLGFNNVIFALVILLSAIGVANAQSYPGLPYVANFGTISSPGADNALYSFVQDMGSASTVWGFKPDVYNNLSPQANVSSAEIKSMLISRPFKFEGGKAYAIKIKYESGRAFTDAVVLLRLAPLNSQGKYDLSFSEEKVDPQYPANIWVGIENILPEGDLEQTYTISGDNIPADGVYALTICVYSKEFIFSEEGSIRIKELELTENSSTSLVLSKIVEPVSSCSLSEQSVSFYVENKSAKEVSSFTAHYLYGNNAIVSEVFNEAIPAWGRTLYTFSKKISPKEGIQIIRIFTEPLDGEPQAKDSLTRYIAINSSSTEIPVVFDFSDNRQNLQWNIEDNQKNNGLSWEFRTEILQGADVLAKTKKADNKDYLISPCLNFEAGKTYELKFKYSAINSEKNENLALIVRDALEGTSSSDKIVWEREAFSNTKANYVSLFYTPEKSSTYHLVFYAYSPDYSEGISVSEISVDNVESLEMDLYYDFDPIAANVLASVQFEHYANLIDVDGQQQAWVVNEIADKDNAYNSLHYIKAIGQKGLHSNDWITFKPFYLEAGIAYTLGYTRRAGTSGKNVVLETYIQNGMPPYSQADVRKSAFFADTVKVSSYVDVVKTFTPATSGTYTLSFRYNTDIPDLYGTDIEHYALYLDNIRLYDKKEESIKATYAVVPVEAELGGKKVGLSVNYKNFSDKDYAIGDVKLYYSINNGTIVEENHNTLIKKYESGKHNFTTDADFSKDSISCIKFWINKNGENKTVDTVKIEVKSLKALATPFLEKYTELSMSRWYIKTQGGAESSWSISKSEQDSRSLPYMANCKSSQMPLEGFLISPLIGMSTDTTYLISFYAKSNQMQVKNNMLSICYSTQGIEPQYFVGNTIFTVDTLKTNYNYYSFYYRPQTNSPLFFALKSTIAAFGGNIWVDDILIIDSATAQQTDIFLSDLQYEKIGNCDREKSTQVSVMVNNKGFLPAENVKIAYTLDNSPVQFITLPEVLRENSKQKIVLPEEWDLSQVGKHSVSIFVAMQQEFDRVDDTLTSVLELGAIPVLPLEYDFEDGIIPGRFQNNNSGNSGWALVNDASSAYEGSSYIRYEGNGTEADDDFVLSCFKAEKGEYSVDFYLRSSVSASWEKLAVYLVFYGDTETTQTFLSEMSFSASSYKLQQILFNIENSGNYAIVFKSKSLGSGVEMAIDNMKISSYGLRDVALTEWLLPQQSESYEGKYPLSVKYKNNGRFTEENIPISFSLNGKIIEQAEISSVAPFSEKVYTFENQVNLQEEGTYNICVYLGWNQDEVRQNDTMCRRFVQEKQYEVELISIQSPVVKKAPYGRQESISLKLRNNGKANLTNVPVKAFLNNSKLEAVVANIPSGGTIVYTFDKKINMSDSIWYNLLVYTDLGKDENRSNDTLKMQYDGRYSLDYEGVYDKTMFKLYPNPVKEYIYLQLPMGVEKVELYDNMGICRSSWNVNGISLLEASLSDLSSGMYILRVYSKGFAVWQTKILKQ